MAAAQRRTEVVAEVASVSMGLRPTVGAGVPLAALAAQVGAVPADGPDHPDVRVTGVTLRGQDVQTGDLFAALPGSTTHGARHVGEAIRRGAVAVLTDAAVAPPPGPAVNMATAPRGDGDPPGRAKRDV